MNQLLKVTFIGDNHTGKTSIVQQYTLNTWSPHYICTIGVDLSVTTEIHQQRRIRYNLWDTAGNERFQSIIDLYLKNSHAIVIVFAFDQLSSFQAVTNWLLKARRVASPSTTFVLLGNKDDLPPDQKQVTDLHIQGLLSDPAMREVSYFPVSAKNDQGLRRMFDHIVQTCELEPPPLPIVEDHLCDCLSTRGRCVIL